MELVNSSVPPEGTAPMDGRRLTMLHQPAGLRSEPMKSLPSATACILRATAQAAPPDEPPLVRFSS